jgi:hypothetical protein
MEKNKNKGGVGGKTTEKERNKEETDEKEKEMGEEKMNRVKT